MGKLIKIETETRLKQDPFCLPTLAFGVMVADEPRVPSPLCLCPTDRKAQETATLGRSGTNFIFKNIFTDDFFFERAREKEKH